MPKRIIIAGGNTHKAEEQALLGDEFECRTLKDYPNAPEVEKAATFAGNVQRRQSLIDWLKHHEDFAEGWVLADDSGQRWTHWMGHPASAAPAMPAAQLKATAPMKLTTPSCWPN